MQKVLVYSNQLVSEDLIELLNYWCLSFQTETLGGGVVFIVSTKGFMDVN